MGRWKAKTINAARVAGQDCLGMFGLRLRAPFLYNSPCWSGCCVDCCLDAFLRLDQPWIRTVVDSQSQQL